MQHGRNYDVIYKVGGAQAIAALAYGTESIPKVDKIVGPGNIYVALAKKAVYGYVSIDAIAVVRSLVIADETANQRFVAADLLSQAEHDELIGDPGATSERTCTVSDEVDGFLKELSRSEIIQKSLDNYGYILVADTMDDVIDIANEIASEHLEIQTKNPYDVMTKVKMPVRSLSANMQVNLWEIILQDRTMCFRQMERPNSSHHCLWMILLRNQVSSDTQKKHNVRYIKISKRLPRQSS